MARTQRLHLGRCPPPAWTKTPKKHNHPALRATSTSVHGTICQKHCVLFGHTPLGTLGTPDALSRSVGPFASPYFRRPGIFPKNG